MHNEDDNLLGEQAKELRKDREKHAKALAELIEAKEWLMTLKERKAVAKGRFFTQKALCIISKYDYYDHFNRILEILLDKIYSPSMFEHRLFEHYVFTIVFEIPKPKDGVYGCAYFEGRKIALPEITELPFANQSHFDKLLDFM